MKKLKLLAKFAATAAFLSLLLTGCSGLGPGNTGYSNGSGSSGSSSHEDVDKPIKGTLTVVETWPGEDDEGEPITYYINSIYTIKNGGDLTIEEGAIVKFGPNGGIDVLSGGSLVADKTIFTSYRDSCGRKILAAGETKPNPGDWKQIEIYGGHGEFTYCEFYYGGNSCSTVTVNSSSSQASATFDHCTFKYNSGSREVDGSVYAALKFTSSLDYRYSWVKNSTFENNVWPLTMPAFFDCSNTNHFGKDDKANEYNLIHINSRIIDRDGVVWGHQDVPYIHPAAASYYIEIQNGASLTIEGGTEEEPTVVEFDKNGLVIKNGGNLIVGDNTHFTNSERSKTTKHKGLRCDVNYTASRVNDKGKIVETTINMVLLLTNDSKNIVIDEYLEDDTYREDKNVWGFAKRKIIESENNKTVHSHE